MRRLLAILLATAWGLCLIAPATSLAANATIERHALCMPDGQGKHWAWWRIKREDWKHTQLPCKNDWAKGFMVIGPDGPMAVHKHRTFGNLPDPSAGLAGSPRAGVSV
jgi:hypothetical protein